MGILRLGVASALAMLSLSSGTAQAATYLFTVNLPAGVGAITGAGQLTTNDTLVNGGYRITSISGTYGQSTITGLLPVNTVGGNDNLLFTNGSPYLNVNGVAFSVNTDPGAGEGLSVNLYYVSELGGYTDNGSDTGYSLTGFTVTPLSTSAVPEPATWAMMMLGFGSLGHFMRRRKQVGVRVRFA